MTYESDLFVIGVGSCGTLSAYGDLSAKTPAVYPFHCTVC